ncbi:MAG: antibiotic biosynthesis monooxygenase [Verrucomicrobia bacterium]|nr:antibiotic biosynthesis monooxygenase [Verrucomicrobiota bacterium]
MLIVIVNVEVKPEFLLEFMDATEVNARLSRQEPGIARFDVIQSLADPTRFVLIEAYRSNEAPAAHKETLHYQRWRDLVEPMMARPRTSEKFSAISPDAHAW